MNQTQKKPTGASGYLIHTEDGRMKRDWETTVWRFSPWLPRRIPGGTLKSPAWDPLRVTWTKCPGEGAGHWIASCSPGEQVTQVKNPHSTISSRWPAAVLPWRPPTPIPDSQPKALPPARHWLESRKKRLKKICQKCLAPYSQRLTEFSKSFSFQPWEFHPAIKQELWLS